jgi:4'-phosphopantetheinyl transferase
MANWMCGPEALELSPEEVHVWRAYSNHGKEIMGEFWRSLSDDERARASRFHFQEHKDRYVMSHGVLRDILRRYRTLVREPFGFTPTSYGKLELAPEVGGHGVKFSLSHSHMLALFAICLEHRIGVDVEHLKHVADWQQIADRFFSLPERRLLETTPEDKKTKAFLTCWTRREAYVKARGEGLSIPMSSFRILESPEGTVNVKAKQYSGDANHWWCQDLFPDEQYVSALVVEGYRSPLLCWHWQGSRH